MVLVFDPTANDALDLRLNRARQACVAHNDAWSPGYRSGLKVAAPARGVTPSTAKRFGRDGIGHESHRFTLDGG